MSMKVSKFHKQDNIVTLKRFRMSAFVTAFWRESQHNVHQNCRKVTK